MHFTPKRVNDFDENIDFNKSGWYKPQQKTRLYATSFSLLPLSFRDPCRRHNERQGVLFTEEKHSNPSYLNLFTMVTAKIQRNPKRVYLVYCPWITYLEAIFDWNNKRLSFCEYSHSCTKVGTSHIWDEKYSWLERTCIEARTNPPITTGISKKGHASKMIDGVVELIPFLLDGSLCTTCKKQYW